MSDNSIVFISGSLREQSTNTAALRAAATVCPPGWSSYLYSGMRDLPHFDPDLEEASLPDSVAEMRGAIERASRLLICTPEYAGDLPGSFKNLLDWTVGGMEIVDKPTAWINVSSSPTKAQGAHTALAVVLGYTGAEIIEEACLHIPVSRSDVDPQGNIINAAVVAQLEVGLRNLVRHAERN